MRLSTSILINAICLIIGILLKEGFLWIPISGLIASLIEVNMRKWVSSDRLGSAIKINVILKFGLSLIGFYSLLSQIACVGVLLYWLFL
jgi:hypothetical protein